MSKSKQQTITVAVAFTRWMKGESFAALAKLVRPALRQADFKKVAGVPTWKQAVAKRQVAVKAARKARAA